MEFKRLKKRLENKVIMRAESATLVQMSDLSNSRLSQRSSQLKSTRFNN